jgi:hypothetical protein
LSYRAPAQAAAVVTDQALAAAAAAHVQLSQLRVIAAAGQAEYLQRYYASSGFRSLLYCRSDHLKKFNYFYIMSAAR